MQIILFTLILLLSTSLIEGLISDPPNLISSWCKQTPYNEQCEFHLTNTKFTYPLKEKTDFLKMMTQSAIEHAKYFHVNFFAKSLREQRKSLREHENESKRVAWEDCRELHDLAIEHLNKTLTNTKRTNEDVQTWLSSALTLYQTCEHGFNDLNVTKNNMPLLFKTSNVTSLISNALAINSNSPGNVSDTAVDWVGSDKFPRWVKPGDRKLLQSSASAASKADIVVAQDGSGDYRSVGQAVSAATSKSNGKFVIYIKAGVYRENVEIVKKNIMLLGDGMGKTIITGSKSVGGGTTTFRSATVAAVGDGFMAQGITFRNTAGPSNHQAVALRSNSDLSVFYQCGFEGYQDTLYVFSNRQFYRDCNMYGTVDYIFGNAAVVIQNCNILARFPPAGTITFTAQGRSDPNQNTGISIQKSRVGSAESLGGAKTYLGRPWQKYSRTVFMETYLDGIVNPKGWLEWSGNFALSTLYYAEYANTGPGSSTANRVNWPGYHVITSAEAGKFTVGPFIGGNSWLPSTGVPFGNGL